jgi:hypothetical protein
MTSFSKLARALVVTLSLGTLVAPLPAMAGGNFTLSWQRDLDADPRHPAKKLRQLFVQEGLTQIAAGRRRAGSTADVKQYGSGNSVGASQSGDGNALFVRQHGSGHTLNATQSGGCKTLGVIQIGKGTTANTSQTGADCKVGVVVQGGW